MHHSIRLVMPLFLAAVACSPERTQELESLRRENAQLTSQNRNLEQELERARTSDQQLRQRVRERSAELIACRMSLPDADTELFARLETSLGSLKIRLFWQEAPYTVQNFVTLAEGSRAWRDPKTGTQVRRPFYEGLTFHRVIPDFMVQGGDPLGNGNGGPGYTFPDEISTTRHFDRAGIVAMANSGPDTNGSQFFILDGAAAQLEGKHTIFGEVIEGLEVVKAMARVPRNSEDVPLEPVVIRKIQIERALKGEGR